MRVPVDWLEEFAPSPPPAEELAEGLTMRGLEVESAGRAGPELPGVVTGTVRSCAPVEGTVLKSCLVSVGKRKDRLRIVCGAPNVAPGMAVAVAIPGARVGGQTVSAREFRGVMSEGMICSERELGLGEDHDGVLDLGKGMREGVALDEALRLGSPVLDVAITPNRGDCLSMLGVGREVRALQGRPPRGFRVPAHIPDIGEEHEALIAEDAAGACPLYGCVVVRGVRGPAAPSPLAVRERLRRCGVRSIGRAVDVTNLFMLAYGQPLHAFDLGRIDGAIRVRFARPGEPLSLLDGQEVRLAGDTLVIADAKGAVAIGGVMGGADSGVGEGTTDILLEGAFFSPTHVRGKARAYNLSSEAAFRFERGVDYTLPPRVLGMAAREIARLCGGEVGPVTITRKGELPSRDPVRFDTGSVEGILGLARTPAQVGRALRRMGFAVEPAGGRTLSVTPPAFRFDVSIKEDLVEEVARDHGYDAIPVTLPEGAGHMLAHGRTRDGAARLCRELAGRGYLEVVTYAFVPEDWELRVHGCADPVRLANPITDEATVMRSSLVGGLLDRARHNRNHRQERLQIAEVGRCFPSQDAVEGEQPLKVAGLRYGPVVPEQWGAPARETDFFDIKGDAEALLAASRAEFAPCADHPALHPGKCARVTVGGETVGHAGALHPRWAQEFELPGSTHLFELLVAPLAASWGGPLPPVGRMSRLPLAHRDLSVVVGQEVPAGDLLKIARGMEGKGEVRGVDLFDCYESEDDRERGTKRLGIRMTLQGTDSNLEERDIVALVEEMERLLEDAFGARKLARPGG